MSDFKKNREGKKQKSFIIFHDAYNYLFQDLNIEEDMVFVFQKNVLYSPKASETRELLNNISRYNIHHVFIEPQFKNSNLEKMANYYTFDILTLDPIGEDSSPSGYIQNLKNNLKNLENIYE